MKLKILCTALLLAAGSMGMAYASPDLIQNGDFSQTTSKPGSAQDSAQFGSQVAYGYASTQFINNWQGNGGYALWFYDASTATGSNAYSIWGQGSNHDTGLERLWAVTAPPTGGSFVGLDGDQLLQGTNQVQASIGQQLTGLTVGKTYAVSFDWGLGQLRSRTGDTTNALQVSFGDLTQTTVVKANPSHDFTGWFSQTFSFTADSSSAFLNFLAVGTPSGLPPMALLSNVSVHAVPEPPELVLFGGSLLALGFMTVFARRRSLRRRNQDAA